MNSRAWAVLAAERESMGMTQQELADKLHIFVSLIRARERGEGNDNIKCIIEHCRAVGFSPVRFMEIACDDR